MRVDWCVSSWFRIKNTHSHFSTTLTRGRFFLFYLLTASVVCLFWRLPPPLDLINDEVFLRNGGHHTISFQKRILQRSSLARPSARQLATGVWARDWRAHWH